MFFVKFVFSIHFFFDYLKVLHPKVFYSDRGFNSLEKSFIKITEVSELRELHNQIAYLQTILSQEKSKNWKRRSRMKFLTQQFKSREVLCLISPN